MFLLILNSETYESVGQIPENTKQNTLSYIETLVFVTAAVSVVSFLTHFSSVCEKTAESQS